MASAAGTALAAAILKGMRQGRYQVCTSADIAVGHWFQRKFAWPYELAIRGLNDYLFGALAKIHGGA